MRYSRKRIKKSRPRVSIPGYVDTQPFPATPVKWTYQAIYRVDDSRVGQWSNPVSVTVGG